MPGFRWPRPPSRPVPGAHLVHAGEAAKADEGKKLERLSRYIVSPAVGLMERLALTVRDNDRYQRGSCRSHEHLE